MCPVTHTYAENGDLATSREYMEFDTKADLQGVSLVQSYAYDAVGRTTEVTYKQGEAVKEKYTQSYDGRNYITQDSYTDGYGSTAKTLNRTYQYDAIGRLTETGVTNGEKTKTTGYQYDKVGNRLYQTVADGTKTVSTKYTYNALGQLTKTQKGLGQAQNVANWYNEAIYTYDNYGNRTGTEVYEVNEGITGSEKIGDVRYSYDESNQMVKYETKGTEEESWTEKARNVYNGEGMRIRQYENGNSWARQYFYIGGALAISTDGSNENFVKSENILTPDGTILAALREAKAGEEIEGNAYWIYHYDARGSATNLVGAKNGSLYRAEENIYDAFGNEEEIKQSTSSVVNDIKFTGATLDNSGTYYLGSRHYDPNTGRFLQQDTFKGEAYSPWTQNLYTYTSNNPVNYVDPTGHILGAIIGGLIGGVKAILNGDGFLDVMTSAASGFLTGLLVDTAIGTGGLTGLALAAGGNALIKGTEEAAHMAINGQRLDGNRILHSAAHGAIEGVVGYGIGRYTANALSDTGFAGRKSILEAFNDVINKEINWKEIVEFSKGFPLDHIGGLAQRDTLNAIDNSINKTTRSPKTHVSKRTRAVHGGGGGKFEMSTNTTRAEIARRVDQQVRTTNRKTMAQKFYEESYRRAGLKAPQMDMRYVASHGYKKW